MDGNIGLAFIILLKIIKKIKNYSLELLEIPLNGLIVFLSINNMFHLKIIIYIIFYLINGIRLMIMEMKLILKILNIEILTILQIKILKIFLNLEK